jgi:hypothetical protein
MQERPNMQRETKTKHGLLGRYRKSCCMRLSGLPRVLTSMQPSMTAHMKCRSLELSSSAMVPRNIGSIRTQK